MMRWLEDFELKHVEIYRSIQFFHMMSKAWSSVASDYMPLGYSEFASRQSTLFSGLYDDAKKLFEEKGEPRFRNMTESTIVQIVRDFRKQELGWLSRMAGISSD